MVSQQRFEVLHILAALGAGGIAASFFLFVNFSTSHPGEAFVSLDFLMANHIGEIDFFSLLIQLFMLCATLAAALHFTLLLRWWKTFNEFKKTDDFSDLFSSNKESQLMAIPLTLAMSMNVIFILGAMYIPGLYSPLNIFGMNAQILDVLLIVAGGYFTLMLYISIRYFGSYFLRLSDGELDFKNNSNLSQFISIFAFSMIAVGFAALGFSSIPVVAGVGSTLSYTLLILVFVLSVLKLVIGFSSIFQYGLSSKDSVTLLIPVTVIGLSSIAMLRNDFGQFNAFGVVVDYPEILVRLSVLAGLSLLVAVFALKVMRKKGFFNRANSEDFSAGDFSMVCPFFAFQVQLVLVLAILVGAQVVEQGSTVYNFLWLPIFAVQAVGIYFYFKFLKENNFLRLSV